MLLIISIIFIAALFNNNARSLENTCFDLKLIKLLELIRENKKSIMIQYGKEWEKYDSMINYLVKEWSK
jgi:transcriptional antiterminator